MRTRYLCLAIIGLSLSGPETLGIGSEAEGATLASPDRGQRPDVSTWEWGTPAIERAHEHRSALISPLTEDFTLAGRVEATLMVPNELPLNRAYQARLRGVLKRGEDVALSDEFQGQWQSFDPRLETVGVELDWSPLGLNQGESGLYTLSLIAEVALANIDGEEIIVGSEPFEVGVHLDVAAAMASLHPSEGGSVEVREPSSPLNGALVDVPRYALSGSGPRTVALVQANRLPAHSGYRIWRSQPLEVRVEGDDALLAPVTLTIPLLPGGEGAVAGLSHWDGEASDYILVPTVNGEADTLKVSTTVTGYWGAELGDGGSYDFSVDIQTPSGDSLFEVGCGSEPCAVDGSELRATVAELEGRGDDPYGFTVQLMQEGTDSPAPLGKGEPTGGGRPYAGRCLEGSWGTQRLLPGGEVFEAANALAGLPSSEDEACNSDGHVQSNPSHLPITRAFIPGKAEFVTWVVPNPGQVYSGPVPEHCSDTTVDSLEGYLGLDGVLVGEDVAVGGSGFEQIHVYPLLFNCLWLQLDPSITEASAAFDADSRPTSIGATLPGSLDASGLAELQNETAATLIYQLISPEDEGDDLPAEVEINEALLAACEGDMPSDMDVLALEAPLEAASNGESTHLTYAIPASLAEETQDLIGAFALKLSQASDASAQACALIPWAPDEDGDGFSPLAIRPELRDCNDDDDEINPDALETCDLSDNDCDESIDEGVTEPIFPDGDGDDFGAIPGEGAPIMGCLEALPDGFVAVDGDCNDNREDVFPGATEVCDGVDQNCDGDVDEGLTNAYYADADGDGFGAELSDVEACDIPEGYVLTGTDCDDEAGTTFPGAPDLCNSIDDDCDGLIDEMADTPLFRDQDLDGFGSGDSVLRCAEAGWVPLGGDCDDGDETVNPGAPRLSALSVQGGSPKYFGCESGAPYAMVDVNEDGLLDGPRLSPTQSLQGAIDELGPLATYLEVKGLAGVYRVPDTLKLDAGHFQEQVVVDGLELYIEGSKDIGGSWSHVDGGGVACGAVDEGFCSSLSVIGGARVSLRGLRLSDGDGSSLVALSRGEVQVNKRFGGGIAVYQSQVQLNQVHIEESQAHLGAGIAVLGPESHLDMANSIVEGNSAHGEHSALVNGAVYVEEGGAYLFNNEILGNVVSQSGDQGAGAGIGGVDAELTLLSNRIVGNLGFQGAGVMAVSTGRGSLELRSNHIEGNRAARSGGGVDVLHLGPQPQGDWRIHHNLILNNTAVDGIGGGLVIEAEGCEVLGNLIAENVASEGAGGLAYLGDGELRVEQSLFYGNVATDLDALVGVDLDAFGLGTMALHGSILMPRNDDTLPLSQVSYEKSGLYGVQDVSIPACQSALGMGTLMAPEGDESPFWSFGPGQGTLEADLRLRHDTTLYYGCYIEPGADTSQTRFDEVTLTGEELGPYAPLEDNLPVGSFVPDCAKEGALSHWNRQRQDRLALSGSLSPIDSAEGELGSAFDSVLLYAEAGEVLNVAVDHAGFPLEMALMPAINGACEAGSQERHQDIRPGSSVGFHPYVSGHHLLRIRSMDDGAGGRYGVTLSR